MKQLSHAEQQRLVSKYGPWALVTGASSGIGLELAQRLAQAGFNLLINGRDAHTLAELKIRLATTYAVRVEDLAADLSNSDGVARVLRATESQDLGLAILSAGYGTSGPLIEGNPEQEVNMLRLNCEAVLLMAQALGRRFAQQGRGGLVLMSSLVAFQGVPFATHYAATKAYVQSLAEGLAWELKPQDVDVLVAAPGPVRSGFAQRADMRMDMTLTPQQIGVPILRALGRRTTVLPGWLSKFLVYALRTVPRWGKVRIMQQIMGGMTQHQRSTKRAQAIGP